MTDALGSTVALTDPSGAVKTSYTYEPFGKTTATGETNANPLRYTSREDDGTGLYYYRARYYHPGLQRFISEDPAGFAAGDTNLYTYVGNNPTNLTDPSGENPAGRVASTCLVNATISGGLSFLQQRLSGRKVNWGWGGVGGAALQGCVLSAAGFGLGRVTASLDDALRYRGARRPDHEAFNHLVYVLISKGSPVRVGISQPGYTYSQRLSAHRSKYGGRFDEDFVLIHGVTKSQARAIETYLLQRYKVHLKLNVSDRSMSLPVARKFEPWVEDLIRSWFGLG